MRCWWCRVYVRDWAVWPGDDEICLVQGVRVMLRCMWIINFRSSLELTKVVVNINVNIMVTTVGKFDVGLVIYI